MHTTNITNHLNPVVKSKRSQSALEYMMTYGWAILIIVIVAVILYSMGIFNPSSSITFTSSGFSPFTVSSSLCNNIGYKIAVLAGPIPNNANSLTINKVYLTSATGANTTTASYTLTNPVTLKSGQSTTIIIPNVACNSANIHYSLSAKIQYSYDVPTIGMQTINTTGTVAGTSITGKPSTLTSYEPITITNSQSSATPNPFQQMVNFTSSDPGFSSIATGNFGQNVEFFYYNGTIIPSWLENYTSTNATWWLKIATIPGGSSETVYIGFAPKSTNLFNTVNDGEASQLSTSYGDYNDILNVMQPGLEYQIWYQPGYSTASPNSVLVGVPVGRDVPLNSPAGISYSKDGPFVTNSSGTYFSGTGYETSTPISGYAILNNNNVLDQIPFENPPIIDGTGYEFQIKFIGFIEVNQSVNFTFVYDDGIIAGIGYGTNTSNGAYWLSNLYHGNLRSGPISWDGNSGPSYGVWDHPGVYRFEIEYSQGAGGAGMNVLTNVTASYYYPEYPPNGVMPSVSFGSIV